MNATHIITLIGIAVAACVAIGVGNLQRKQARQIELFRRDPSVGLIPPPGALTKFLKAWWWALFFGFLLPSVALAITISSNNVLSKQTIISISLNISVILFNAVTLLVLALVDRTHAMFLDVLGIIRQHVHATDKIADVVVELRNKVNERGGT